MENAFASVGKRWDTASDGDNFSVAVLLEACRVLEISPNELLDQDDICAPYMMRFADVLKNLDSKEMEIITSAAEGMKKGFQEG